jgi:hypothetical protein
MLPQASAPFYESDPMVRELAELMDQARWPVSLAGVIREFVVIGSIRAFCAFATAGKPVNTGADARCLDTDSIALPWPRHRLPADCSASELSKNRRGQSPLVIMSQIRSAHPVS